MALVQVMQAAIKLHQFEQEKSEKLAIALV